MAGDLRMNRYARQSQLPSFGEQGTASLQEARVLVIGAGGLAAPVLQYLVGAGVGEIRLADADTVDFTNLHRQTLFREDDIGRAKAEVAASRLSDLNSDVTLSPVRTRFDPASVGMLCEGVDLVLDCADSFAASYVASDYCLQNNIPLISASVVGTEGYCGGFCGGSPSLRAVFPDLPDQLGSCDADGVLGPSVGVIGSLQAQMAVSVLAKSTPSPLGQLVRCNLADLRFSQFRFDNAPEPEDPHQFVSANHVLDTDYVVELRGPNEPGPKIPYQLRTTVAELDQYQEEMRQNERIVLVCRSGLRAWKAADKLTNNGHQNLALIAMGDGDE